jgi:hypothetical protein
MCRCKLSPESPPGPIERAPPVTEGVQQVAEKVINSLKRRASIMGKPIEWETSLTTAKAKSKRERKLILMDFHNNL